MCDKWDEINHTMARYQRLTDQVNDQQVHKVEDRLLAKLEAEKVGLHPQRSAAMPRSAPTSGRMMSGCRTLSRYFPAKRAAKRADVRPDINNRDASVVFEEIRTPARL